jgi:glycosyltransferase involved in cell wall biosynthesis
VLVGGFPGEWEGEHPVDRIARTGASAVYVAGWYEQEALPTFFNAADLVVLASDHEPFGQALVEGMACGLPAVAVAAGGPLEIVTDGVTGWLAPPQDVDDVDALTAVLVDAVNQTAERRARGEAAYRDAHARFTWPAVAGRLREVYEEIRAH